MKKITVATLLLLSGLNLAVAAQNNEEAVSQLPDNLITAEDLDLELQDLFGQAPADADDLTTDENSEDSDAESAFDALGIEDNSNTAQIESFHPGRPGGPGGRRPGHPGGHHPGFPGNPGHHPGNPGHHPGFPHNPGHPGYPGHNPGHPSYPGHHPGYPGHNPGYPHHPGPRLVTCFAQSPYGSTYRATAYSSYRAQRQALNYCTRATGYRCIARGCNY